MKFQNAKINLAFCRSILSKSGIDGVDFAINPYVGCLHGCLYCYAKFMKKYTGHTEAWGRFVDIKINAPDKMLQQLKRAEQRHLGIGTVTDPYQPVEQEYRITRRILKHLTRVNASIHLQTKSSLIQRDLTLLKSLPRVEVCWTIITLDEEDRSLLEPAAAPIRERLKALEKLSHEGVRTSVFMGPLLPFMDEKRVEKLLRVVWNGGAKKIFFDRLNYAGSNAGLLRKALKERYPQFANNVTSPHLEYYEAIGQLIESFCTSKKLEFVNCT